MAQVTPHNNFTDQQRLAVWLKAAMVPNKDSGQYRLDPCGALIEWSQYGVTTENGTGWEIDHIIPVAHGGTDRPDNLQALQWEHNRIKGDGQNVGYCTKKWTGK